jgi:hypothetical protein
MKVNARLDEIKTNGGYFKEASDSNIQERPQVPRCTTQSWKSKSPANAPEPAREPKSPDNVLESILE